MIEDRDLDEAESAAEKHRKFHQRIAYLFFALTTIVGLWMILGPDTSPIVLLLVELPLFVILAFIGIKSLLKAATGIPSRTRRR